MFAEFQLDFEVFYHIVSLMLSNNYTSSKDILRIYTKSIIFVGIRVEKIKFESGESDKYVTYRSDK